VAILLCVLGLASCNAPGLTERPVDHPTQMSISEPVDEPVPTSATKSTDGPAPTTVPQPTEKPTRTSVPSPTEKPGPTSAPTPTDRPALTSARGPTHEPAPTSTTGPVDRPMPTIAEIIPMPVSVTATGGVFSLTAAASIYVEPGTAEMTDIGQYLADRLNPSTGYGIRVLTTAGAPADRNIYLTTVGGAPALGEEGYDLAVTPDSVTLVAYRPAGLFRGIQTIRQLLPPSVESSAVQIGRWEMATGSIRDYPRYAWRGAMLDVARHFFGVEDVKRYIDLIAYHKMNRFHLHLADDQGWRIMIHSWPNLATHGGSTEVGGGPGGYYTQAEYSDIVAYAESRYITVVPEIDMPGHTNAALASYPELNCDGVAPALFTGIDVGFSSLCTEKDVTYAFVDDVVREVAALTPGLYFHVGGDEAFATSEADYQRFVERAQAIVQSYGKQMVGWEEIARADLLSTSIAQHWNSDLAMGAVQQGAKVIMSPASKVYLDMKYHASTPLGFSWTGYTDVQKAYAWDPATVLEGVSESDVLGVEAPLWSETIETMDDIEFMAFPRLPGHAEIGWSPAKGRNWNEYRIRLAAHGLRLTAMGVDFYRSSLVRWR
jgi:hexosaminidase